MKPIIKVEGISKKFRINPRERSAVRYETLRESLGKLARAPFTRNRKNGKRDDTVWALKDVNFEVYPGEVMGIIGSNGAGKSTLLKVLSRIIEPTSGRVELYGRVASLLEVGTGFHPDLSGRENVYLNGAILGMRHREIDERFDEIVAFAEVERFIDTVVKHYSSGMYLRLAFAVAAHLDPEILIVDEVLAVGDAAFQKKCLGKMDDVTRSGRTVLLVTHGLAMVTKLCRRAVLFNGGRVIKMGPAPEVVAYYEATSNPSTGEELK
jgi:lipopolysaccharide transport system ATP-binding protein